MKRLLVLGSLLASLVAAPTSSAATPFTDCPAASNGLLCATLSVPLDYANPSGAQVPLYVEELPAVGTPKGVMIMLAGGPGQASAETFDLTDKADYWRSFFPGYTLVAYDDRGTGKSGPLDCPYAQTVAQCGTIVSNHAFYTTREHGEDIESVRLALGVDKIGIWASPTGPSTRSPTHSSIRITSSGCYSTRKSIPTGASSTQSHCG